MQARNKFITMPKISTPNTNKPSLSNPMPKAPEKSSMTHTNPPKRTFKSNPSRPRRSCCGG